jgi:competence protein ComFC
MLDRFKKSSQQLLDLLFPMACVSCGVYGRLVCEECLNSIKLLKNQEFLAATNYSQKVAAKMVSSLKYDLLRDLDFWCAEVMFRFLKANQITFDEDTIITFVPMHYAKQQIRTFNQAELIAQKLSIALELPCFKILTKVRRSPAQMTLNQEQRLTNLKGTITSARCDGKKILLIDDVFTTGTTFRECKEALYKGGAKDVRCFAFCKD